MSWLRRRHRDPGSGETASRSGSARRGSSFLDAQLSQQVPADCPVWAVESTEVPVSLPLHLRDIVENPCRDVVLQLLADEVVRDPQLGSQLMSVEKVSRGGRDCPRNFHSVAIAEQPLRKPPKINPIHC